MNMHSTAAFATGVPDCNGTCYLTYDLLGSVRLVTDTNQNVVARHDFIPFGEEIPNGTAGRNGNFAGSSNVTQGFTGQEADGGTASLDFYNARHFAAALGSFVQPDPMNAGAHILRPQSWNAYAYVLGNPLGAADPTGRACASRGGVHANITGCNGGGNYGGTDDPTGGGGGGVSSDGGSTVAIGTFGSGNPAGGESGVQCPNNICQGVTATGASYTVSANANGDTYASGLNLLPGLTFNCSGTLDNHQCTPTAFSSLFLQSGSEPMYFGNLAQLFSANANLWSNTAGAGNSLVISTAAAVALPFAVGYVGTLATAPGVNVAYGKTFCSVSSVMYGVEDLGYLQGSQGGAVNAVSEWSANRYFNIYNWTVRTIPTFNPSAVLATEGQTFSSCVMAAACAVIRGLITPF